MLEEIAKAIEPVNANALSRVSGLDPKNVYEECARLNRLGIFRSVTTGRNQTGYLYSNTEEAEKLREFVRSLLTKKRKSRRTTSNVIEMISASLPMTEYYFSLPLALRITFDVFYSPRYLMIFVDKRNRAIIPKLRSSMVDLPNVIIKAVSLWGREFKYDQVIDAPLASNEQSIADGLNYYGEIRDREIIRTLLARTSDFDLRKVIDKLDEKGIVRLYAIVLMMNRIAGKLESEQLLAYLQKSMKGAMSLDKRFKSDLGSEAIPMLLPNDEMYSGEDKTLSKATVTRVLKSFA